MEENNMKRSKNAYIFQKIALTIIFLFGITFAQSNFLSILDKYLNSPVEIEFEQRTFWHVRERESRNRGNIILGTNDRFNITSGRMQFVSDGTTYWEFNNRQRQVIVRRITPNLPLTIPTQILRLLRNAQLSQGSTAQSVLWQDDETRRNGFERVEVFYDDNLITRIILTDSDQNVSTYTFNRTTFLTTINDNVFVFEIPRGAQVHED
jgi:outer membrane lipoprotein-sorting protein